LRSGDSLARLGGDEFAAIIEGLPEGQAGEREADNVASRLLNAVESPFLVAGREIHISASLGVAVGDPEKAAELLRASDAQTYGLKSRNYPEQYQERRQG
jgi:diguanylate cyclase (GGDEF)-like protein